MKVTVNSDNQYRLPPEGSVIGTVKAIVDDGMRPNPFREGELQHRAHIIWTIFTENGPVEFFDWVTVSLHKKARLTQAVRVLLGRKLSGEIELDDLIGKSARLEIGHYTVNGKTRAKAVSYSTAKNIRGLDVTDDGLPENLE